MRTLPLLVLAACIGGSKQDTATALAPDDDQDGFREDVDCADDDPEVNPGAEEACDGIDNNCDGEVDEGVTSDFLPDADGDGFADPDADPAIACERPDGYLPASAASDCDDTDPLTYPGANEYCDGVDNDCDGQADPTECRPLDSADIVLRGEADGDRVGSLVAGIGDTDGDGFADILIGAPEADPAGTGTGIIYIMAGPVAPADELSSEARATISGDSINDRVGTSASGGEDFDGDGIVDLALGAWGDPTRGAEAGSAYVFLGPLTGDMSVSEGLFEVIGTSAGDAAGLTVALLGDMDGDGLSEVIVGAPNVDGAGGTLLNSGAAYVFRGGSAGSVLTRDAPTSIVGLASGDYGGQAVAPAGDVNGDGLADLLFSAPNESSAGTEAGMMGVFLGPATGALSLATADATRMGEAAGDHAGSSLAPLGDMNGDGFDDVLVGAPDQSFGGTGAGAAYVLLGPISGPGTLTFAHGTIVGRLAWDHAGNSVANVGDATGDGELDMLIGAYIEDSGGLNAGAAFMVAGPLTGTRYLTNADAGFIGEAESDLAGWSVAGPGDVDGDGLGDVLVGAPQNDNRGTDAGAAYMLYAAGF
jgi:hypothetical protein